MLAALVAAPAAHAQLGAFVVTDDTQRYELVRDVEYIEDRTWTMDLHEAMAPENEARYIPANAQGDINFSFSQSAYWLRFKVVAATESPQDWLLEIRFPPLDRVEVYVPDEWGNHNLHVLGDRQAFGERLYRHRNLVLPFKLQNGAIQTIYMRVTTDGTVTLPMTLWDPMAFAQQDELALSWLMLYLGMICALAIYNLVLYLSTKERMYFTYASFAAAMGLAQASYAGVGFQYLWPEFPAWAHFSPALTFVLVGVLGCAFTRDFLNTRQMPRFDRIIVGLMCAFALGTFCTLFFSYYVGIYVSSTVALLAGIVAIAIGIHGLRKGMPGARYFLIAWSLLAVGVVLFCSRTIGLLPSNFLTTYALQIGSAFEMMLLALALANRINSLRREKEAAQEDALRTQTEMLAVLHRKEHELEASIEHRTRELEVVNKQLRDNESYLQDLAHHDSLTGLANRVLLYERIGHALANRRRDGGMLAILLIDMDHFKPVNDRYGHAVGDHLLVAIAKRFEAVVRESDTVARLGGDEFVVLLESVADSESVEQVVTKLRAEAARVFTVSELNLHVSASIGIALYPHHGADAQTLLARADAGMYGVKRRKPIALEAFPADP
ncbi:MAG TPA: diguanylate cyclase [Burkholderiales bacterium]|nr:diguanylate cyclase [Burkholderiales bacterium]